MRKITLLSLLLLYICCVSAQDKQVKNVILMIPDGASLATISSARWTQWYQDPQKQSLFIDPYICGTVQTFSSNAPIGDSAPTTSCYMTGVPSRAGYVSTYPVQDPQNDIYPMDPEKAYQPLMTVLEAAKITKNMSTGLVTTCEFPHATPADCAAHSYDRGKYEWIAPQMAHNDIDVVLSGGAKILTEETKAYLQSQGVGLFLEDMEGYRNYTGNKIWSLFSPMDLPYDLDRDPAKVPSLAEMTTKAIEKLSTNPNGFFMMVEGSKIDWAAHANDAAGMIYDYLAFDKACGVAFDFARKNGETLVIILADHGNSGISLGSSRCPGYGSLTKDQLFSAISKYKLTAEGLEAKLKATEPGALKSVFKQYTDIDVTNEEYNDLLSSSDYDKSSTDKTNREKNPSLNTTIKKIMTERTCFGFTTGGHTGEEVLLSAYHPKGMEPRGLLRNFEINDYLCEVLGLKGQLENLTTEYFAKHSDVFNGYKYNIIPSKQENGLPSLTVKNKKNTLTITPNTNMVTLNKKTVKLNSVIVYVDKNNTFYLPRELKAMID